ncbi:hypothetical protein [Enterovibrio coralii]|uniref:Uncharacterized protein n=1 Tax=Enterovibrio coralii TaxID=294935 RepID=A0A135IDK2_9GAMM|nr:hypothetical protein [Enterovibrio coralii]KXF83529.1 hypothetical protein ATN88_16820 [Enterovibrio coralii]
MSFKKSCVSKEITDLNIITVESDRKKRSIDVLNCMIFQFKKANITFKHEKFVNAYNQSLKQIERGSKYPYLCFDHSFDLTYNFVERLRANLAKSGWNYSFSKLANILAKATGFNDFHSLFLFLKIYQNFTKYPWKLDGKNIVKPDLYRNNTEIHIPLRDVNDNSNSENYREHHISVAKIRTNSELNGKYFIYIPYTRADEGEALRCYSFDKYDALAWLISHAIIYVGGVRKWNNEIKGQRMLNKALYDPDPSLENIKKRIFNKINIT